MWLLILTNRQTTTRTNPVCGVRALTFGKTLSRCYNLHQVLVRILLYISRLYEWKNYYDNLFITTLYNVVYENISFTCYITVLIYKVTFVDITKGHSKTQVFCFWRGSISFGNWTRKVRKTWMKNKHYIIYNEHDYSRLLNLFLLFFGVFL